MPWDEDYPTFDNIDMEAYSKLVKSYFPFYPSNGIDAHPKIVEAIENHYWRNSGSDKFPYKMEQLPLQGQMAIDRLNFMVGDAAITCSVVAIAQAYASKAPVYVYEFAHRTEQASTTMKRSI